MSLCTLRDHMQKREQDMSNYSSAILVYSASASNSTETQYSASYSAIAAYFCHFVYCGTFCLVHAAYFLSDCSSELNSNRETSPFWLYE